MVRRAHHEPWTLEAKAFVKAARVAHLATVAADGTPHVVPVCFTFDGSHFYSVIDQKPKSVRPEDLRRVRNINENPNVSLVIDRYDEDWTKLGFVLITGKAEVLPPRPQALDLLRAKYPQYQEMDLHGRPVIRITPVHITAWGDLHV